MISFYNNCYIFYIYR